MKDLERRIRKGELCPHCHKEPELADTSEIYQKSYGKMWICRSCDVFVGCHKNSTRHAAKGMLCGPEGRLLRKMTHHWFDGLWKRKMKVAKINRTPARNAAYKWAAKALDVPEKYMHIAMITPEECLKLIGICIQYYDLPKMMFVFTDLRESKNLKTRLMLNNYLIAKGWKYIGEKLSEKDGVCYDISNESILVTFQNVDTRGQVFAILQ